MRNTLFEKKEFIMHSGGKGFFKIECDALTHDDVETLALIIAQKIKQFTKSDGWGIKNVYGVPNGGSRLANALQRRYWDPHGEHRIIIDDVLTTGNSMIEAKKDLGWDNALGIVVFARGPCPVWITPIFDMSKFNNIRL